MGDFVYRTLTAKVSLLLWFAVFVGAFIGFCFVTGLIVDGSQSVLYSAGVLVERHLWGGLLLGFSSITLVGFATNKNALVRLGSTAAFLLWFFAIIGLTMASAWYVFVTVGLLHLLVNGYIALSSSAGILQRRTLT